MPKFNVKGTKDIINTAAGLGPLVVGSSATARRAKLLYFGCSSSDTPLDQSVELQAQRCTALGTGGTVTLTAAANVDPGDLTAPTATAKELLTVTPTPVATSVVFSRSFNLKFGMDFYAPPDAEIWYPAITQNGIFWDTPRFNPSTGSKIFVNAVFDER